MKIDRRFILGAVLVNFLIDRGADGSDHRRDSEGPRRPAAEIGDSGIWHIDTPDGPGNRSNSGGRGKSPIDNQRQEVTVEFTGHDAQSSGSVEAPPVDHPRPSDPIEELINFAPPSSSLILRRLIRHASRNSSVDRRPPPPPFSYSIARRPAGPMKRDFQDHNPPRTPEELYSRYDPSVAVSTGVVLGGMLCFIVGRVAMRCVVKMTKRQLRKTKRFAKYFPERELPPLHVAQQIAAQHGIALPESLIAKLMRAGSDANLKRIADTSKSPANITAAAISPLIFQQNQQQQQQRAVGLLLTRPRTEPEPAAAAVVHQSPSSTGELLGLIRVNIIGATPSITPNASHKLLPELAVVPQHPPVFPAPPTSAAPGQYRIPPIKSKKDENGHLITRTVTPDVRPESAAAGPPPRSMNALLITTATIETQPLLHATSSPITSSRNAGNFSSNNLTIGTTGKLLGPATGADRSRPLVHRSASARTPTDTLTNGGGGAGGGGTGTTGVLMNSGALDRRRLSQD